MWQEKHLLDKLNECLAKPACRIPTLTILGQVVRKQPSWIHKITRFPLLASLLKCLKTDSDVVVLVTGVLVLITLLPMIPQAGKQNLYEFFDIFGRLAAWNLRNPGHVTEVFLIHLHASVYSLFHRLYGMYPCNFVSYLRSHYSMKENVDIFEEVVKPMLEHVRIHPELVTGTKDHELDPTRWKKFEIHDIVIECAKVSLDPKEASCEEGYSTMPDNYSTHPQLRPTDYIASSYTDLHSSFGSSSSTPFCTSRQTLPPLSGTQPPHYSPHTSQRQILSCDVPSSCVTKHPIWSPSSICGMATPPSSRGISPTSTLELSQSTSHYLGRAHVTPAGGKGMPSSTPVDSSPHPTLTEELMLSLNPNTASPPRKDGRPTESSKPCLMRQEPIKELERGSSVDANSRGGDCENVPMTLRELSVFFKEQELEEQQRTETEREVAMDEELLKIVEDKQDAPVLRGFDSPFYRTTETLTGTQEKPPPAPLAPHLPHPDHAEGPPATVFTPINHPAFEEEDDVAGPFSPSPCKTPPLPYKDLFDLALPKAASLFMGQRTAEAAPKAGEGRGLEEVEGSDVHDKVLKRLPLPSKSADWTHFGAGSAPLDELQMLRSQLLLLHNQLQYERYKREQHAVRNRRLLRRIINATALQEQNNAMKDQLSLQTVDILSLRESLQVEQQRYRQLWADRETVVTCLHKQIRQLQQGRDEYYRKNQELQSKLQEYQQRIGELEVELQRANNKVCNTGHQLNQLSVKLTTSETIQQQMAFLNKQLLLLGEVNRLCVEGLQHSSQDGKKEVQMLQASSGLEAAQQRMGELESQLAKKEHLIAEQKKFLEDAKGQARSELQASESRYQAQRKVTQTLQTELLQLYSRLETESPDTSPGGTTEPCSPHNTRSEGGSSSVVLDGQVKAGFQVNVDGGISDCQRSNSSTLSPGILQVSPTPNSVNGSQEPPNPLLAPLLSRLPSTPPSRLANVPLTVGSYPSAKSFLGMQARELFRNKSESQCHDGVEGEEPAVVPPLAGLSQGLKTELCIEPVGNTSPALPSKGPTPLSAGPAQATPAKEVQLDAQQRAKNRHGGGARGRGGVVGGASHTQQRQQQHQRQHQRRLRIMDYNETHHEHS
ncbi:hypothetical protein SKAU_G00281370 [Synaphobranchus kaupii]|uniref:Hamartin n=1 Tax=Synaphobranchus kaupii TaxID=118154 RepID=A0A9Q1INQ5_SYNKA|nr:hypothetical protein SKAU_G00281370 [Synaphobranchus kaupii]